MHWLVLLKADFKRKQQVFLEDGAQISMLRTLLTDGFSAMLLYRLTHTCASFTLTIPIAIILQWLNKTLNGCVIGAKAKFGAGFVLMHPNGVVINSKVRGGTNITLESGVVIGDEKGYSPKLGSNIYAGSGAKIIGKITIGDNVKIGANAVVVKSVNDGETVVGIPARPTSGKK